MSGLDPLAAFALAAVANAQASIDEAAINLGALLQDFRAQIAVGDILNATVLPPQNGSDRLLFLGQTIAAQLPPGINPGETLALQVTGFTNTAILVRNLGVVDETATAAPAQQAASASGEPLPAPLPAAGPAPSELPPVVASQVPAQRAILTSSQAPRAAQPATPPAASAAPPAGASGQRAPVAPPRELFVAASVRPTAPHPAGTSALPGPTASRSAAPGEIEARIAATRARSGAQPPEATPAAVRAATARPPVPKPGAARPAAPANVETSRTTPPRIAPRLPAQAPAAPAPSASQRPTPEAALLARLRVPITATTLGAARIVDRATRTLTTSFEKLDALLAKLPPDERTASLRSSLSFVARFDMRNVRSLPEQIGAYLSHIVSGAESKVAQIVRAWSENVAEDAVSQPQDQPAQTQAPAPAHGASSEPPAAPAPVATTDVPATVAARAAERDVALAHDVKTALLQLVAAPPNGSSPQVVAALRDALTATTAVQLNALQAQTADPSAITIPLPAYFYEGGAPAHLRVSRDAPKGKQKMDADNFHIAFVLDTASLGTVAIDLTTVGRSVSVDVKAEAPRFADRFRSTLPDLRARLEQLQYRVASMGAATAARASAETTATAPAPAASDRNVDMRA